MLEIYEAGCICLEMRYYMMTLNIMDVIYMVCDFCQLYSDLV